MKKRTKKALAILMTVCITSASLIGCGKTEENQTTSYIDEIKERGVLKVGTNGTFAPFTFIDQRDGKNENVGSDIELAKYIADSLGVELEIATVEQAAVVSGTAEGKYDLGISACGKTAEREKVVDFTDLYFVADATSCETLIVRIADADNYTTLESFSGKKVGCINGSVEESLANAQLPKDATIQKYENEGDGMIALQEGKIDAFCSVDTTANLYIKNNADCGLVGSGVNFQVDEDGAAIIMAKNLGDFYDYINNIVNEVKESGQYLEWVDEATELSEKLGVE